MEKIIYILLTLFLIGCSGVKEATGIKGENVGDITGIDVGTDYIFLIDRLVPIIGIIFCLVVACWFGRNLSLLIKVHIETSKDKCIKDEELNNNIIKTKKRILKNGRNKFNDKKGFK